MRKRLIIVALILASIVLLASCGKKHENLDQELINEIEEGMNKEEKDEYEEFLDELDEEIEIYEKEQEQQKEKQEEFNEDLRNMATSFSCTDQMKNAELTDPIIQVADMTFPIDWTMTLGEFVEKVDNSSLKLEYDIPLEGIINGSETYKVLYNGETFLSVSAKADGGSDYPKDALVTKIGAFPEELTWFPKGVGVNEGISKEDLLALLEENGFSSDGSTAKTYKDDGTMVAYSYPGKEKVHGQTKEIQIIYDFDEATRELSGLRYNVNSSNVSEENVTKYYSNSSVITSASQFTPEIKKALLEDAQQYIGKEIGDWISATTTLENIDAYEGYIITSNRGAYKQAGNTRIIYTGTSDKGNTVYFGINYPELSVDKDGNLYMDSKKEPDGVSLDISESEKYEMTTIIGNPDYDYEMIEF